MDSIPQTTEKSRTDFRRKLLARIAQEDSPRGFRAYFRLMHTIPLHSAGKKWIDMAYEAHAQGKGFLDKAHRESAKTTVFSKFFFSFRIGHEPAKCNMIIRINDEKANDTTQEVAQIIEHNNRWKMVFPHVVPDKKKGWGARGYEVMRDDIPYSKWSEIKTEMPPDPTFVGYGWEAGSVIGSRVNGILIVDDIHDRKNTSSNRQLQSVKDFYTDTLNQVMMSGSWQVWNYTPWTTDDLYAYVENTDTYILCETPLLEPVDKSHPEAELWPKHENVPMSGHYYKRYWPEVWPWERITNKYQESGEIGFARMYLLDLERTKGVVLKESWLHKYPADEIDRSWPVYMGVDYASTTDRLKNKDRDYFALAVARARPGGGIVIVDGLRAKLTKGSAIKQVSAYANTYPTLQLIGVESLGKGEEFYNDLLFSYDMTGNILPLMEIKHGNRSKGERFENWLAPRFEAGRIWISNVENPFLRAFKNEWMSWNGDAKGAQDDALDAVYMCAVAAEGELPSRAQRTGGYDRTPVENPFNAFAN